MPAGGGSGSGPDEQIYDAPELVGFLGTDPEWEALFRSRQEHHWRASARPATEEWIELLIGTARYLSDLIGGDVPVLAPRDVVEASAGTGGKAVGHRHVEVASCRKAAGFQRTADRIDGYPPLHPSYHRWWWSIRGGRLVQILIFHTPRF